MNEQSLLILEEGKKIWKDFVGTPEYCKWAKKYKKVRGKEYIPTFEDFIYDFFTEIMP